MCNWNNVDIYTFQILALRLPHFKQTSSCDKTQKERIRVQVLIYYIEHDTQLTSKMSMLCCVHIQY